MNEIKYIRNIEGNQADIYLYGEIGSECSATHFMDEFKWLESNKDIEIINVRINSGGGLVIDGASIFMLLINSKKTIHTYNDFFALSTAGWILLAGDKIHMSDVGKFMIHDPSGGSDKALNAVKDSLIQIFVKRTGETPEDINDLMSDETWMTADEVKNRGWIDEIIDTSRVLQTSYNAMGTEIVNKILNKTENKQTKMKDLANKLNLDEKAEEKDFINKFDEMSNSLNELNNKVQELETANNQLEEAHAAKEIELESAKNEIEELENKINDLQENENKSRLEVVNNIVSNAIEAGKIKEEAKDDLVLKFADNVEALKLFIENIITPAPESISNSIDKSEQGDERKDWTIRDWEKNDPKGLVKMEQENKKKYDKLFNEFYG